MIVRKLKITDIPSIVPHMYGSLASAYPGRVNDDDYYQRLLCTCVKHNQSLVAFDGDVFNGLVLSLMQKSIWNNTHNYLKVFTIWRTPNSTGETTFLLMNHLVELIEDLKARDIIEYAAVSYLPGITNINYERRGFKLAESIYVL